MKYRKVKALLYAHPVDMGGIQIRQPLPTHQVEQVDPFLLLHHADIKVPAHVDTKHAGVGPHPHRGFSPVTFIFKGGVHHRDSRGNNSVVYEGGAQWMNAGMGVIHSERPPHDIQQRGGRQEIIQLWVNTPAANKMDKPTSLSCGGRRCACVEKRRRKSEGEYICRRIAGHKVGHATLRDVNAATIYMDAGGRVELPAPASHSMLLYLLDGNITLDGHGLVEGLHAVVFENNGDGIALTAKENTRMLFLTGEPLSEEVVSYGPFVMNTQTQIMEAMRDYQKGKMGVLIEDE
ncbi:MAG: pirin family protein [Bacteroidia bacterium]|nr:pirin family protein [Bacteroidia bacterium]